MTRPSDRRPGPTGCAPHGARRRRVDRAVAAVVVGAALLGACTSTDSSSDDDVVRLDDPQDRSIVDGSIETLPDLAGARLPAATVIDVDGAEVSTASFLGTPTVLNFWFTTCPPCATELPAFGEVAADADDIRFVGIDPYDTAEPMVAFAAERGVTYDLYRDDSLDLVAELDINFFPVTVFVASDGTIVNQTGALDAGRLRSELDQLRAYERGLGS